MKPIARHLSFVAAAVCMASGAALAEAPRLPVETQAIVDTPGPGGIWGYNGFDVFAEQSVAARFTVPEGADVRLARVSAFFMNNSEVHHKRLRVSVQTDARDEGGADSLPSGTTLEVWDTRVQTTGWNPLEQQFTTRAAPLLKAGRNYWVVASSMSPPFVDPVWVWAKNSNMVTTTTSGGAWQPASSGAALTLKVDVFKRR